MKKAIEMTIAIGGVCILLWVFIWLWVFSGFSALRPVEIKDEYFIEVIETDVRLGNIIVPDTYVINGKENNIVSNKIYDFQLLSLDIKDVKIGGLLKCVSFRKGWIKGDACGNEITELPSGVDLAFFEKMSFAMIMVLILILYSNRWEATSYEIKKSRHKI